MQPKNVQIPFQTFQQMAKLCEEMQEFLLIHQLNFDYYSDLEDVLATIQAKQASFERRQAYGELMTANKDGDEDKQTQARINYLQQKRR
ncbi:MAG: hypothetical protein FWD82_10400 [Defluviitaleaceae bacterium]|nr:hypothetical protein [Defluviitaleaceae bacterium]